MLRIRIIGLAIMAVFAMTAVAASSASAHEWLIGGKPITAAKTIMSHGTLLLEDSEATGGAVAVNCPGFDTGTVGPGALDVITKVSSTELGATNDINCTFEKAGLCESSTTPTALAINLPWMTEIYTASNGEIRDMITADGAGSPGWKVTCKAPILGTTSDECTVALGSTALANVTGGVDATFEKESQKAKCSKGGKESGIVKGIDFLLSPSEGALTFF